MSYSWTDDPLHAGQTLVKTIHITELFNYLNNERNRRSMSQIQPGSLQTIDGADINNLRDGITESENFDGTCPSVNSNHHVSDYSTYHDPHNSGDQASYNGTQKNPHNATDQASYNGTQHNPHNSGDQASYNGTQHNPHNSGDKGAHDATKNDPHNSGDEGSYNATQHNVEETSDHNTEWASHNNGTNGGYHVSENSNVHDSVNSNEKGNYWGANRSSEYSLCGTNYTGHYGYDHSFNHSGDDDSYRSCRHGDHYSTNLGSE